MIGSYHDEVYIEPGRASIEWWNMRLWDGKEPSEGRPHAKVTE
jgi:hypothetical protein